MATPSLATSIFQVLQQPSQDPTSPTSWSGIQYRDTILQQTQLLMTNMDLSTSVQGLLMSEKYSDITLKCDETIFKVHRAIVCTRSPVLAAAFDGNFKEGTTSLVDLSANELSVVTAMVNYLYSDNYDDNSSQSNKMVEPGPPEEQKIDPPAPYSWGQVVEPEPAEPAEPEPAEPEPAEPEPAEPEPAEPESAAADPARRAEDDVQPIETTHPIVFNTKVYLIADQYDIPSLKKLAKTKFKSAINQPWSHSTSTTFTEATEVLWENTLQSDRLLRDFVVEIAVSRLDALLTEPTFVALMERWGDLAVDILKAKHFGTYEQRGVVEDPWGGRKSSKKSKGRKYFEDMY